MNDTSPILVWFRRDLRLSDHAALSAACDSGRPVIPVFVHDSLSEKLGAAPKWRLGLGVGALADALEKKGSRLILRRSDQALDALQELIEETGAGAVYWSRLYDPETVARDSAIKEHLKGQGIEARFFGGHLMFEPWTVETKTGGFYKVYSPFWKSVKTRDVEAPRAAPSDLHPPTSWPNSDDLADWQMDAQMNRGAAVVRPFVQLGETAAQARLGHFIAHLIDGYKDNRNTPAADGTSNMSENLSLGEISPHQCWHAGQRALQEGKRGAETFLKELVWREFAYHLMHHTPRILDAQLARGLGRLSLEQGRRSRAVKSGRGRRAARVCPLSMPPCVSFMSTGRMHNRGRMIVASYLTKHLMTHWRIGQATGSRIA